MPCIVTAPRTLRRVTVARQAAGLSRSDLADRTGIELQRWTQRVNPDGLCPYMDPEAA
jgi:transcriptional regulator with XRE-family HTH domain